MDLSKSIYVYSLSNVAPTTLLAPLEAKEKEPPHRNYLLQAEAEERREVNRGILSPSCLQLCRDIRTNKHFKQNALPRVAPSVTLFNDTPDAGIFKSNEQCIKLVLHEVKKKRERVKGSF